MIKHCLTTKPDIPAELRPSCLFLPVITTSYTPLTESDYNLHKSNSTYFSDLDVSRSHLVCCLLQPGIHALTNNKTNKLVLDKNGDAVKTRFLIMLGGVMCNFKREIGIGESYEMWSRLLCWDRKWVYIITHFVKKGAVKPKSYILADGSWFGQNGYTKVEGKENGAANGQANEHLGAEDEKYIFATAISKYVIKLGRLTVHPEVLLGAAGMLPSRPGGWATMNGVSGDSTPMEGSEVVVEGETTGEWDWRRIEEMNQKGLALTEHFTALERIHGEFSGSREAALGTYRDFLF